jgi:hypothetical protein
MYKDPNPIKRAATCVSWYPDGIQMMAIKLQLPIACFSFKEAKRECVLIVISGMLRTPMFQT